MMQWAHQHGVELVLSTKNYNHLREWLAIGTFTLPAEAMNEINDLSKSTPHTFYNSHNPAPPMWVDQVGMCSVDDRAALVETTVAQIRLDQYRLEQGQRISDLSLSLPSIKGVKSSAMADSLAIALTPSIDVKIDFTRPAFADMSTEEKQFVTLCSQRMRYQSTVRKLRHQCFRQRQVDAEEKKANGLQQNMCCLPISKNVKNPEAMPVEVAPSSEVKPFFDWLKRTDPDELPSAALTFLRGTVFPDGRMDFCKQVTGNEGFIRHFLLGNNIACQGDHVPGAEAMAALIRDPEIPIETWYLAGNAIGPKCMDVLCLALERNTHARALWLKRNPIESTGAGRIGCMLTINRDLELLDLHNCGLLDEGMHAFADGMIFGGAVAVHQQTMYIQHVYLDANGLTPDGGRAIAKWLSHANNKNVIKSLYCSINRLGDEGCIEIAESLRGSTSLMRFCIGSNGLTDRGFSRIVELAKTWPALISLDVGYYKSTFDMGEKPNYLGRDDEDETVRHICVLMKEHQSLQYLSVLNNQLSPAAISTIANCARIVNSTNSFGVPSRRSLSVDLVQLYGADAAADDDDVDVDIRGKYEPSIRVHTKAQLRVVKHADRVIHIDSIYRNSMK